MSTAMASVCGKESPLVWRHEIFCKRLTKQDTKCWDKTSAGAQAVLWDFEHQSATINRRQKGKYAGGRDPKSEMIWSESRSIRIHCGLAKSAWQRAKGYWIMYTKQRMSLSFIVMAKAPTPSWGRFGWQESSQCLRMLHGELDPLADGTDWRGAVCQGPPRYVSPSDQTQSLVREAEMQLGRRY